MEYRLVCWIMNVKVEVTADLVGGESEGVWQCNIEIRRRMAPGAANYLLLLAADFLSSAPCISSCPIRYGRKILCLRGRSP